MRRALLELLRCPACKGSVRLEGATGRPAAPLDVRAWPSDPPDTEEVLTGNVVCGNCAAQAPIVDGIPRLTRLSGARTAQIDKKTQDSFSLEWSLHRPEDGTWGMTAEERTRWYFLQGVGMSAEEAVGLRVLDAGCGNGSSTLGIARLGAACVGVDQSSGVFKASEYLEDADKSVAAFFVQANLLDAPFASAAFDVVFSAGVLHHTPDTRTAFLALAPLVKPGGRFYVWLYRHEAVVTPVLSLLRAVTTRLPPLLSYACAIAAAPLFVFFTAVMNRLGLRSYRPMRWRSAALALLDIFASRYAHAHSYEEVKEWYEEAGFERPIIRSLERRGFSVCGTKRTSVAAKTGLTAK